MEEALVRWVEASLLHGEQLQCKASSDGLLALSPYYLVLNQTSQTNSSIKYDFSDTLDVARLQRALILKIATALI